MKILFPILLLFASPVFTQHVLPFTGLVCENHGINGEIEVLLAEQTWTSNRLPAGTEFEIKLNSPSGFAEQDGVVRPGIAVVILSDKGDTLGSAPNILSNELDGFTSSELSKLSVTLDFGPDAKPGDIVLVKTKFFDQNSDRYMNAEMLMVIAEEGLPLETSSMTWSVFGSDGYNGIASGIEISRAEVQIQEATDFSRPKKEIILDSLVNLTRDEFNKGKISVWEYTTDGKPNQLRDIEYYTLAKSNSDPNAIDLKVIIPMGVGTVHRFRWESTDRQKVMDIVSE